MNMKGQPIKTIYIFMRKGQSDKLITERAVRQKEHGRQSIKVIKEGAVRKKEHVWDTTIIPKQPKVRGVKCF